MLDPETFELENAAYKLTVTRDGRKIGVCLYDRASGFEFAEGPYIYRAVRAHDEGSIVSRWLVDATIVLAGEEIRLTGGLAGLHLEHTFRLPHDRSLMEERITLHNLTTDTIALSDIACGMQRPIANDVGGILPEVRPDRIVAIPFRHRATDPPERYNDYDLAYMMTHVGRELRVNELAPMDTGHGYLPSSHWFSEGWAWVHGDHTLGVFKFNQEAMEFSAISIEADLAGASLRFGGVGVMSGEPSSLRNIEPGQSVELGWTRYQTVAGDALQASYAFRAFLDEHGCRFPEGFDPPVHWNELYDNPEWHVVPYTVQGRMTRPQTYTKELLMQEAAKAVEYGCQSLYLDPGWDVDLCTFVWGEQWLGDRKQFIRDVSERFGLHVSLHCPLASWLSLDGRNVSSWPRGALQVDQDGRTLEGRVCLGSRQYLDEAERRLLEHCADGVVYLMFDGNWWYGTCWSPDHGHPVPYTMEDHCRANLELARRIHARYPHVLIEMHDMITGGSCERYTPVYYKYGLPGSYDDAWGFELMWEPREDIVSGRAKALYYYNIACNVPIYLHVDLRDDNEHCLVLWWYASTCRHLGIGGTHDNPMIAEAQKRAMKRYRRLERFYKRGNFYGAGEEVHFHSLPEESAFVVNLFNLSDEPRFISGAISLDEMGLDCDRWYVNPKGGRFDFASGTFTISRRLAPWSAAVAEARALDVQGPPHRLGEPGE